MDTVPSIFTRKEWFKFPLPLRQRWWRETDYGRLAPSSELLEVVRAAVDSQDKGGAAVTRSL